MKTLYDLVLAMPAVKYPSLYEFNTRVWLYEQSLWLGRNATLDDITDETLDRIADRGFDWVWFLSVWKTGPIARAISRSHLDWVQDFQKVLPDLSEDDIIGSGFAIADYSVHENLGGDEALERLRSRMRTRGLKLMLDFVPNHMSPDHGWVHQHPEYFVQGNRSDLANAPANFSERDTDSGRQIFAHGRDPNFPGWADTVQLNYGSASLQLAMKGELTRIARQCDGLRCDMAMLLLPSVFKRTWGIDAPPFWEDAIKQVRSESPDFVFLGEVYWDMEWELQCLGFDYCYDKRLYDRLSAGQAGPVRDHLRADLQYQNRLARFLENHDETRVATKFPWAQHQAAAVLTFLAPGMRFFHQGEFEGNRIHISPHLRRGPIEAKDKGIEEFYSKLLSIVNENTIRNGQWQLLACQPAWSGNGTHEDCIAFQWSNSGETSIVVIVNYSDHTSQCRVPVPIPDHLAGLILVRDRWNGTELQRDANELRTQGISCERSAWGFYIFEMARNDGPRVLS